MVSALLDVAEVIAFLMLVAWTCLSMAWVDRWWRPWHALVLAPTVFLFGMAGFVAPIGRLIATQLRWHLAR